MRLSDHHGCKEYLFIIFVIGSSLSLSLFFNSAIFSLLLFLSSVISHSNFLIS
ncbi:MAG: hypothetical protein WCG25_04710 [bacterium]